MTMAETDVPRGLMRGGHQCRGRWHWTAFQIVPTLQ